MKILRWLLIPAGLFPIIILSAWIYTSSQLAMARSNGVFPSAELSMRALLEKGYKEISSIDILYAGTNSFDGSKPYIWYVIAEVRAASRADGSKLGHQGCDAPGTFFLQTREGWVHLPEGAFPEWIGFWMNVFGIAGPGQSTPSTDWAPSQPSKFCQ